MNNLYEIPEFRKRRLNVEARIKEVEMHGFTPGQVRFVPVSQYFEDSKTKSMNLIDPKTGQLVYKDKSHVNREGALRVMPLFRKEIFHCGKTPKHI